MGGTGLFSSVVEHWSRKPGVVSSILTGGIFVVAVYLFLVCLISLKKRKEKKKTISQPAGFEPARGNPI
jgi:hypothetical protein